MEPQLEDLLVTLRALNWLHMTRDGGWVLARRLSDATPMELFSSRRFDLPRETYPDWPVDAGLAGVLRNANAGVAVSLDVPLANFRLQRAAAVPMAGHGDGDGARQAGNP